MTTASEPIVTLSGPLASGGMTVTQAISRAAKQAGAVGKNARMESGPARYSYRSLDDLMDAVHGPLADNGVVFVPSEVEIVDTLERTTKSGSIQYHLRAKVTFAIYGPEGDFITAQVLAEGTDTGDKAGNKLMSTALKYCIGQVLSLPYTMEDQDATLSEPVAPATAGELHARLATAAERANRSVEEITAKFRAMKGNLTMEQFHELPASDIQMLVTQIESYLKKQR